VTIKIPVTVTAVTKENVTAVDELVEEQIHKHHTHTYIYKFKRIFTPDSCTAGTAESAY